jgi:predicted lipoprotein with Yx(FWY)xxD motif
VPAGASVQAADNPAFGQILVAANGMTLYTFEADQNGQSACTSVACVSFWPPYILSAPSTAGADLVGALGTITRPDGSLQVTYNGMPLYTFAVDKNPGEVKGDAINEFGGIWHVTKISSAAAAGNNVATKSGKKNNKKKRNNPPPMYNYNY